MKEARGEEEGKAAPKPEGAEAKEKPLAQVMEELEIKERKPRKIMACIDGSPTGKTVFATALKWKKPEDELFLVNAPELIQTYSMLPPWSERVGINKSLVDRAEELLKTYATTAKEQDVPLVSVRVLDDLSASPKQNLVNFARDEGINLVFIGTRGMGAIKRAVLGSYSRYMVHNCDCDVMIVKPQPEQAPPPPPPAEQKADEETPSDSAKTPEGVPASELPEKLPVNPIKEALAPIVE